MMRRVSLGTAIVWLTTLPMSTAAHLQNERSLYEDIQFTPAQEEIVYLRGISVIAEPESGAQLFRPQDPLTRSDLAYWAARFRAPSELRESATSEELRDWALDNALVPTLEGEATYSDVNSAYFDGDLALDSSRAAMTREEFAEFMGRYLTVNRGGKSLMEMAGIQPGPAGAVDAVEITGAEGEVVVVTIGEQSYLLDHHPKVLYAPADPPLWVGRSVAESWIRPDQETATLLIVEFAPGAFTENEIQGGSAQAEASVEQEEAAALLSGTILYPVAGFAILSIIGLWLFWRRSGSR